MDSKIIIEMKIACMFSIILHLKVDTICDLRCLINHAKRSSQILNFVAKQTKKFIFLYINLSVNSFSGPIVFKNQLLLK